MSEKDIQGYIKLAAELAVMRIRLNELSEAGFSDMEGADADEFAISEALYYCCDQAATAIGDVTAEIFKRAVVTPNVSQ